MNSFVDMTPLSTATRGIKSPDGASAASPPAATRPPECQIHSRWADFGLRRAEVAKSDDCRVGFIEIGGRSFVEGCDTWAAALRQRLAACTAAKSRCTPGMQPGSSAAALATGYNVSETAVEAARGFGSD
jgi:hypothetical protein